MFDLLIRNASVFDGSGGPGRVTDVAITGDTIAAVGSMPYARSQAVLQADGLSLLPGFIDTHTHSDAVIANGDLREAALRQGVTTEIIGSCGIGTVPLTSESRAYLDTVKGIIGPLRPEIRTESVRAFFGSTRQCATNYALQLAHSPLRCTIAGCHDTELQPEQLNAMQQALRGALSQGACAFTTGLSYFPAAFCNTQELVALCRTARDFDAPFCIHQRTVTNRYSANIPAPLDEAFAIAKQSGVRLHLSHYKTRPASLGQVEQLTQPIERALDQGLQVTADFYPFPVGCGYIAVNLPLWVMDGTPEQILSRLADPMLQQKIAAQMEQEHPSVADGRFTHAPNTPSLLGKTYTQAAQEMGLRVSQMLVRFLHENALDGGYMPTYQPTREQLELFYDDCAALLRKPYYMVGSDTLPAHGRPHPRSFHTFSTILSIAKSHALPLGLLAERLSAAPAALFHLQGRGRIAPGCFADLVLLDPAYQVRSVWVNGRCTVENGCFRPGYSGRPLQAVHRPAADRSSL